MENPHLIEFVVRLIQDVRDEAIRNCDACLSSESQSPIAKRWRSQLRDGHSTQAVRHAVPDCIDEVVFSLLHQIDTGRLRLTYTSQDGSEVDLVKEGRGEMAGWYMGSGGWRHHYAKERCADDAD